MKTETDQASAQRSSTAAWIRLSGVTKRYENGAVTTEVLKGVELAVERGDSLAIVGPSGSGKSTLLNILGGLELPSAGQVSVAGTDLVGIGGEALASFRNRSVGFVFQLHHLLPQCTALENVLVPSLVLPDRSARSKAGQRGKELLESVGLGSRLDHRPAQLSGGECQRVAVVRALINEPSILLADEPTGSLDERSADELADLLSRLRSERDLTLVCVTHSAALAARMQRSLELRDGVLHERPGASA
ncbi:MAG: ABC transporter ATP-binding protein [Planctomycetota bacterium]